MTHLKDQPIRSGPAYVFQFTQGEGHAKMMNGKAGIVTPANNNTSKSASFLMPIYGNADTPPTAMYFMQQALTYLNAREPARLARMSESLARLRYYAQTDPEAKRRLDLIYNFAKEPEAPPAQYTQAQAQQGYQSLSDQQAAYSTEHYEQTPGYQQAPPYDPNAYGQF